MTERTKVFFFAFFTSSMLSLSGCAYDQQSKFQMSFLPPVPRPAVETVPLPVVQPNLYLHDMPTVVAAAVSAPTPLSRADNQIQKADQHFQKGKKYYQAKDTENARKEFDAAIDLMLEASDNHPSDRQAYEKKLDEMVDAIHRYDLAGLGASLSPEEAQFEKAPLEDILEMTFPVDPKLTDKVKEQVQATGSQLPLSVNDTVLGYIHYFSGRGRRTVLAGLQRQGRYRPLIQRILDEEGIPQELIHLAQAESGFLPRAVSRKAAAGMWQFMAWRGQQYGLMQTRYTDDRLDPEKATRAAARHLHDLYNKFGDWYLAMAAYNCGPGVIEKAVERTGYVDFWELRRRRVLPAETTNYVPIILAMTIMTKNAQEYGLDTVVPDPPLEYETLEMKAPTHLALAADLTDTPVSQLMALNPALLRAVAPAGYSLRVPKGTANGLMAALQLIPPERRVSWRMHTVTSGETLSSIGKRYGAAPGSIAAANGMESSSPVTGDRLVIPAVYLERKAAAHHAARQRTSSRHVTAKRNTSTRRASASGRASAKAGFTSRRRRGGPVVLTRTASHRRKSSTHNN